MKYPTFKIQRARAVTPWRRGSVYFCLLLSALCFKAWGQTSYSIDWYSIDGGGGTGTGGVYTISGTIGQPDAGTLSGANYSLTGGFWSLVAVVQTAGAPTLAITRSGNTVIVSWPYPSTGWTLQQCPGLAAGGWAASTYTVATNGAANSVTIMSPAGNLFFRLHQP